MTVSIIMILTNTNEKLLAFSSSDVFTPQKWIICSIKWHTSVLIDNYVVHDLTSIQGYTGFYSWLLTWQSYPTLDESPSDF